MARDSPYRRFKYGRMKSIETSHAQSNGAPNAGTALPYIILIYASVHGEMPVILNMLHRMHQHSIPRTAVDSRHVLLAKHIHDVPLREPRRVVRPQALREHAHVHARHSRRARELAQRRRVQHPPVAERVLRVRFAGAAGEEVELRSEALQGEGARACALDGEWDGAVPWFGSVCVFSNEWHNVLRLLSDRSSTRTH